MPIKTDLHGSAFLPRRNQQQMYSIGLDIGTTTVSAAVVDSENKTLLKACNLPNDSWIASGRNDEKMQDPERIYDRVRLLLDMLLSEFPSPSGIGLTGQMHGILYVDRNGKAVSPLYTWQDRRSERSLPDGSTALEELTGRLGYPIFAGYGIATHHVLSVVREVPVSAVAFCTIADDVAMRLTGKTVPVIHPSNAASLGGFDLRHLRFDADALEQAGISAQMLPEISDGEAFLGDFRGIPVRVAIGDNQAGFLGAVGTGKNILLVNIGTGSQVSAVTDYTDSLQLCELRPFIHGKYLAVGASLCGGRAYAMLADFYRLLAKQLGCDAADIYDIYGIMNTMAVHSDCPLSVDTSFAGTRADPNRRGSICNIGAENFTPENLTAGFLHGMVSELLNFYEEIKQVTGGCDRFVGSGNGYQNNPALQKIISNRFSLPGSRAIFREEAAACGAALYGAGI